MPTLNNTMFTLKNGLNCYYKPRRSEEHILLHSNKFTIVESIASAFLNDEDAFVLYLYQDAELEMKRRLERDIKKGKSPEFIKENVKIMRKQFDEDIAPLLKEIDLKVEVSENFTYTVIQENIKDSELNL